MTDDNFYLEVDPEVAFVFAMIDRKQELFDTDATWSNNKLADLAGVGPGGFSRFIRGLRPLPYPYGRRLIQELERVFRGYHLPFDGDRMMELFEATQSPKETIAAQKLVAARNIAQRKGFLLDNEANGEIRWESDEILPDPDFLDASLDFELAIAAYHGGYLVGTERALHRARGRLGSRLVSAEAKKLLFEILAYQAILFLASAPKRRVVFGVTILTREMARVGLPDEKEAKRRTAELLADAYKVAWNPEEAVKRHLECADLRDPYFSRLRLRSLAVAAGAARSLEALKQVMRDLEQVRSSVDHFEVAYIQEGVASAFLLMDEAHEARRAFLDAETEFLEGSKHGVAPAHIDLSIKRTRVVAGYKNVLEFTLDELLERAADVQEQAPRIHKHRMEKEMDELIRKVTSPSPDRTSPGDVIS